MLTMGLTNFRVHPEKRSSPQFLTQKGEDPAQCLDALKTGQCIMLIHATLSTSFSDIIPLQTVQQK